MEKEEIGWYAAARAILSPQEISAAEALRQVRAEANGEKSGEPAEEKTHMLK